jgi:hypothetical protein
MALFDGFGVKVQLFQYAVIKQIILRTEETIQDRD